MVTLEQVSKALPAKFKSSVTQSLVDTLNSIDSDPIIVENIRNNFISYTSVLQEGRFKLDDYINAVAYVSYKFMKYTNEEAYFRTFPSRHLALVQAGRTPKEISSYVSAYSSNKLVSLVMEQSLIPSWVLNQDIHQEAINTLASIMRDEDVSPKVRVEASTSLLSNLAKPKDVSNFQVNINTEDSSGLTELKNSLRDMAQQQREWITLGGTAKSVAETRLVIEEGVYEEVGEEDPR